MLPQITQRSEEILAICFIYIRKYTFGNKKPKHLACPRWKTPASKLFTNLPIGAIVVNDFYFDHKERENSNWLEWYLKHDWSISKEEKKQIRKKNVFLFKQKTQKLEKKNTLKKIKTCSFVSHK